VYLVTGSNKLHADESRRLRPATEDTHHYTTVPRELRRRV